LGRGWGRQVDFCVLLAGGAKGLGGGGDQDRLSLFGRNGRECGWKRGEGRWEGRPFRCQWDERRREARGG